MRSCVLQILGVALFAGGCGAKMNLEVLAPAQVGIPSHIKTVAYVDRSRAKNAGQGILGAIEGAFSGEGIGADTEGRKSAATGFVALIDSSPRFEIIEPNISKKELDSSLFDKEMDISVLRKICDPTTCQGVISLEAFDSDSDTTFSSEAKTEKVEGKDVRSLEWSAVRTTNVLTAWRFYDAETGQVLDNLRDYRYARSWTGEGKSKGAARRDLPNKVRTVRIVAEVAGGNYGRRVSPHYVWVIRSWYGGGSDQLKQARSLVRSDNWEAAADVWRSIVANDPDPKVRGKAQFNLALAAEVQGDIAGGIEAARKAVGMLQNEKSRAYQRKLMQRQLDQERVWEQMGGAEEEPPPAPPAPPAPVSEDAPLAIPGDAPPPVDGE
jgi:hypothetical protein